MSGTEASTLDKILTSAKTEFLAKGYQAASLRNILRTAGLTTGAFYGYFKNKQELFEALVGEQYRHILEAYRNILVSFQSLDAQDQADNMEGYSDQGIQVMTEYLYENYDAFKLILCCSEGTAFHNLVEEMANLDLEATHDFAVTTESVGRPVNPVNANLERTLTRGMFTAYFELIVRDVPKEEAEEYIGQMMAFYSAGWKKIMGY